MSGDQDAEQPVRQEIRGDRDAFAAGRDLTINNYFGKAEQHTTDSGAPVSERAVRAGLRAASSTAGSRNLPGRRAMEWNPLTLGVHRAIQVPGGVQDDLPEFVVRPHDLILRAEAASAVTGSKLIMLVGSSSTGKTRSAVEALRSAVPDWHLFYPLTAAEVAALIAERRVGERAILWLNETQVYLEGNDGADAAEALRGLLVGGQPLLIVGTLWPEYWLTYMRPPEFGAPDPHSQVRQLLETAVKIDVPDRFTESDLAQVQKIAARDLRLAVALSTKHGHKVTQVLAGGPDLIDRWHNAPNPYCRAVITAAIDTRRLGHLSVLSAEILHAAAAVYLDGPQRAAARPEWFDEALSYARKPVKGAIAPLTATSQTVGQIDGYLLADYLDQHGRAARRRTPVPNSLWTALASHARTGADLSRLGTAAADRGRYQQAVILWTAASQDADMSMTLPLRRLLSRAGHHAEAERVLWRAAEEGDQEGLTRLTGILMREERHHELEHILRRTAATGHHQAAHDLAVLLIRTGRGSEAVQVIRQAVANGDQHGQRLLGFLLQRTSPPEHAEDTGQSDMQASEGTQAPAAGPPRAGQPDVDQNKTANPNRPGRDRADAAGLPGRRKATPRSRNSKARAASGARQNLPSLIAAAGVERQRLLRSSGVARREPPVDRDHRRAAETPAEYWRRRQAETEQSLQDLIRAGDVNAERELAVFLIATDRISEGENLLPAAASAAGDAASLRLLAEVLIQTGRAREATLLTRYGLAEDGTTASAW
jgi:hypothetical protein